LDAALANNDKAIGILEHAVGNGHGQVRADLLDAWLLRANVLAGRGEHARASDEATSVARQEGLGGSNYYNIACIFALSSAAVATDSKLAAADRGKLKEQYASRAMEFLRRAVDKGFQSAASLKTDGDLAALRSRADFQTLLQEVEQKSKQ
jgi:hypothetical protein